MKKLILPSLLLFALTGCGSIPVDQALGTIDTHYDFGAESKEINKRLAIVFPSSSIAEYGKSVASKQLSDSLTIRQLILQSRLQDKASDTHRDIKNTSFKKHNTEVMGAFKDAIGKVVMQRGFTFSGSYETLDDIVYRDKKETYLVIIPELDIQSGILFKSTNKHKAYVEESGELGVNGTLVLKMVEPLTQRVIMQKRIDLSKTSISEPYVIQKEVKSNQNDLVVRAISNVIKSRFKPKKLINNFDQAYAKLMTKFYQHSMQELDKFVSQKEMLEYEKDIAVLKKSSRF